MILLFLSIEHHLTLSYDLLVIAVNSKALSLSLYPLSPTLPPSLSIYTSYQAVVFLLV
jgi:hypothetical protein